MPLVSGVMKNTRTSAGMLDRFLPPLDRRTPEARRTRATLFEADGWKKDTDA